MEKEQLIERLFQNSIAAKIDCIEVVTQPLLRAATVLTECLLGNGKLLVCGNGGSSLNAQFLVATLMNYGERERPGLPALLLASSGATQTASGQEYGSHDVFARQIRALGQADDCLVLFTRTGTQPNLLNAVSAAHARGMPVVALTAHDGGNVPTLLEQRDAEVRLPLSSRFRIYEMHLLLSFGLCELIELQLFGGA